MDSAHLKNKFNTYDSDNMYSQFDYHLDGAKEDPEEILRQALRSSYSRRTSVSIIIVYSNSLVREPGILDILLF